MLTRYPINLQAVMSQSTSSVYFCYQNQTSHSSMNTSKKECLVFANLTSILSDELNGFLVIGSLGILKRTLKGWRNIGLNVHAMN